VFKTRQAERPIVSVLALQEIILGQALKFAC